MDEFSHGGKVYVAARELGLSIGDILDFSANINPLGLPDGVPDLIKDHIGDIVHYPDESQFELLLGASKYYDMPRENIIAGNGSAELIHMVIEALRPRKALIPSPTFSEYSYSCRGRKIPLGLLKIQPPKYQVDDQVLEQVLDHAGVGTLVILCNPNNPTGQLVPRKKLTTLLKGLKEKGAYLMVDEAFIDFVGEEYSLKERINSYTNLIILRSLTKFFAIPGLRLGFALAAPVLIDKFKQLVDPWNINTFAGIVAPKVMGDKRYISETRKLVDQEKEWLWGKLQEFPDILPLRPQANYIFGELRGDINASTLAQELKKRGILIRECANYPFLDQRHFRVAIKDRSHNELLIEAIGGVLGGQNHG